MCVDTGPGWTGYCAPLVLTVLPNTQNCLLPPAPTDLPLSGWRVRTKRVSACGPAAWPRHSHHLHHSHHSHHSRAHCNSLPLTAPLAPLAPFAPTAPLAPLAPFAPLTAPLAAPLSHLPRLLHCFVLFCLEKSPNPTRDADPDLSKVAGGSAPWNPVPGCVPVIVIRCAAM